MFLDYLFGIGFFIYSFFIICWLLVGEVFSCVWDLFNFVLSYLMWIIYFLWLGCLGIERCVLNVKMVGDVGRVRIISLDVFWDNIEMYLLLYEEFIFV